jgi:RND family efflux transporter MFP subunit
MNFFSDKMNTKTSTTMRSNKLFSTTGKLLAVAVVLSFSAYACSSPEESPQETENPVTVAVETAKRSQMDVSNRFSGTVKSEHTVNLSSKVMGTITQLDVEAGDFARKGDVLLRIKDDNLQAQKNQVEANLAQARSALQNTETNYKRLKALHEKGSATQKEFDDISTQYEAAQANVKALQSKLLEINDLLDYTVLEAPFDGYVVAKLVSQGDLAGPGQPLISFEQQTRMKVVVTVPETEISRFGLDDTVLVDVKAAGRQQHTGVVSAINPSGSRASRQFMVEVRLPELSRNHGLKSGMFAEVGLTSTSDSLLMVPKTAIIERGQLTGLYTLTDDSEVMLRWVRLGDTSGDQVVILSGLAPDEQYVSSFEAPLREGQKVNIQ